MREVVLRVPRAAVEHVLDRLLLIVPSGVREAPAGRDVDLKMRGADLPTLEDLKHTAGRWPHRVSEHEVSDDWQERRRADYTPEVIGGRLVVRPEWAPGSESELEIVIGESAAFGSGIHPTTRTCLELLLGLEPAGSFADLGSGSGILAIVAAQLGWHPVVAIDIQPGSVAAARENAGRNSVSVDVRNGDLAVEPPPPADGFVANIPATLHEVVAARWQGRTPRIGLLSGFGADEARLVARAYARAGLRLSDRFDAHGWTILVVAG